MKDAYSFDLDFEGAKGCLQPHVRRLSAYLRAAGAEKPFRCAPRRGRSAAISANELHHPGTNTGESAVFCDRGLSAIAGAGTKTPTLPMTRRISGRAWAEWTTPLTATTPTTCMTRAEWSSVARGRQAGGTRHPGRPTSSISARNTRPTWVPRCSRPRRQGAPGLHGNPYWHRAVASRCAIIEASHDENSFIWPRVRGPFAFVINMKAGDAAWRGLCDRFMPRWGGRYRRALRRHRPEGAGGKFPTGRPDRPAVPDNRPTARRGGERGGDQEQGNGRTRDAFAGCRDRHGCRAR